MYLVDYNKLIEDWFTNDYSQNWKTSGTKSYKVSAQRLAIDITDETLQIGLLVPGHSAETLTLDYDSDKIRVKSKPNETTPSKIENELVLSIDETLSIGKDWDGAQAEATITNGVLYISIPKFEERKPKKLSIKVG
jgi:HSP20 family molecular chaperone IbpA